MSSYELLPGDVIRHFSKEPKNEIRFHAVLSDPPYGLSFMSRQWDSFARPVDFQTWVTEWSGLMAHNWLYPGALGLFYGGNRTFHRLACGLEDAGYEIVDTIMYMYGSGFPKGLDISKAIDKANQDERPVTGESRFGAKMSQSKPYGQGDEHTRDTHRVETAPGSDESAPWHDYKTLLKPAYEPVILARAPRKNIPFADLARQFRTGALNIGGARIPLNGESVSAGLSSGTNSVYGRFSPRDNRPEAVNNAGRYPSNVILDPEAAARLDDQSGESVSSDKPRHYQRDIVATYGQYRADVTRGHSDSGSASRFYYVSKATPAERDAGLGDYQPPPDWKGSRRNLHPTVKPIPVNEYLARLILPPDTGDPRNLLVPFSGTGSEIIGAHFAGWDHITGIEAEPEYIKIARLRLEWWRAFFSYDHARQHFPKVTPAQGGDDTGPRQLDLFGGGS